MQETGKITVRSLVVGTLFAIFFTILVSYFDNRKGLYTVATQIATMSYFLLFVMVLLLNPVCRALRVVRRFTVTEVMVIFIMGSVSAGMGTFGLAGQLLPAISGLYNRHWNNDQSEWNLHVEPVINEAFFLAESGTQEAARDYRESFMLMKDLQRTYDTALRCRRADEALAAAEKQLAAAQQSRAPDDASPDSVQQAVGAAREASREAKTEWNELRSERDLPEAGEILATYPAQMDTQAAELRQRKTKLRALEEKAFAKVEQFRRGLPESMRAFPGIVPTAGESLSIYVDRLRRLKDGVAAHRRLGKVSDILHQAAESGADARTDAAVEEIRAAAELLQTLGDARNLLTRNEEIDAEWSDVTQELAGIEEELLGIQTKRRKATAEEFRHLDRSVRKLGARERGLRRTLDELSLSKEQIKIQLEIKEKVFATAATLSAIASDLDGTPLNSRTLPGIEARVSACRRDFPAFDASLRRFLIGDVPWRIWVKPTLFWLIIVGLTYVVLMSFNLLIFRQWAYNERLVYPLAELPEILAGHSPEDTEHDWVPAVFRSGLFWIGVAISGSVLSWNLLCFTQLVPGLVPLNLGAGWSDYILNTPFEGLLPDAGSYVFFTLIGLTFLVPTQISFSLWFFYVLYMLQLLILVWAGHGVNASSFPKEWWYTLNFSSAEAGGALMVFASVVLFKCRKYLFCCFAPSNVGDLAAPERRELRISSFLFIFGTIGLILSLWLGLGANVYYTLFVYFVVMVITIGLIRAVTEGGILGFQAWVSPFHFIRTLFGMDKTWTSPSLFAPLMVYYSIFFLDLKTFIAPAMANSIKIRDDLKMRRGRFHLAILLAILLSMAAALGFHLMLGYNRGADAMSNWFYTGFPRGLFDRISNMTKTTPVDATHCSLWMAFGAVLMAALLYGRRLFFWLPHPIGLIMLVNPIMRIYWFSIFLGWLAKSLVTKYGTKDTYRHVRKLFIGLIVGELAVVILAMLLSYKLGTPIRIDLNR